MMLDAYGQDVLARCGFKALNGHPYDPVFQKEPGFLFLMTTGLKGGGRVIHNSRCDPNPSTGNLNKAGRRNLDRFPPDFMFQLKQEEYESLRFHFGILKRGQHSKYLPCAFTEQGVAMLSSVLRSKRAVHVNIEIMRAFVRLRQILTAHKDLERKLVALENKYDEQFRVVFEAIRQLMRPPATERKKIGFESLPRTGSGVSKVVRIQPS